jgi:hypothetical protein
MPIEWNNRDARRPSSSRRRLDPRLQIAGGVFSKETVGQIVDDWIVPALVDEFLRRRMNLPDFSDPEHNVGQP